MKKLYNIKPYQLALALAIVLSCAVLAKILSLSEIQVQADSCTSSETLLHDDFIQHAEYSSSNKPHLSIPRNNIPYSHQRQHSTAKRPWPSTGRTDAVIKGGKAINHYTLHTYTKLLELFPSGLCDSWTVFIYLRKLHI